MNFKKDVFRRSIYAEVINHAEVIFYFLFHFFSNSISTTSLSQGGTEEHS